MNIDDSDVRSIVAIIMKDSNSLGRIFTVASKEYHDSPNSPMTQDSVTHLYASVVALLVILTLFLLNSLHEFVELS